jgi:hypothetical protein
MSKITDWVLQIGHHSIENFDVRLESVEPFAFIDHTLSYFFKNFNTVYPVVHRATFLRKRTAPLLLLAMSAAGALYSNIPGAKAFSYDMSNTLMSYLPKSVRKTAGPKTLRRRFKRLTENTG